MKCLIVYQSKSGYTKRYMEMLVESVKGTLVELKAVKQDEIHHYDEIIYAAGVYAGKISGIRKFYGLLGEYKPKKLVVIAVGAAPATQTVRDKLISDNFSAEMTMTSGKPEFFCLQGGFDPNKLNFFLKQMLGMVSKNLQKKQQNNPESLTEEDKGFLEFFQTANDQTSKEQLVPVINFLIG